MGVESEIKAIVESIVEPNNLFLVQLGVTVSGHSKVKVEIDSDKGATIDDCTKVSRSLSQELELLDPFPGRYNIEVSTPGADQPFRIKRQYHKNIGRKVRVLLTEGTEVQGILKRVEEEEIQVLETKVNKNTRKKEEVLNKVPFHQINKTNVIISFN